ncbi:MULTISPECIES: type I restriction enzyme endonuclease domain-containing protein [unclassified Streptomyces]|uniref:type I restriction enzyme endonuclease domain-containing protein n=1 Tax=unclassified Streptomyces TaxID=2593676 RepID=UPI0022B60228|nr:MULTISPECIES: type I restriction enzyme endonuclease domain-containing protein [unclassified Streptomyces]MCZ7415273.1 DUF3387 domain-containing protein [Streptomyces sp. WMMC897]MCZ7432215.1 DUF3387 domain-containing protein [Streptomyces sp. WMMC1477]
MGALPLVPQHNFSPLDTPHTQVPLAHPPQSAESSTVADGPTGRGTGRSAEVIAKLAALAREVSEEARRGERFDPPLSHAELAFYDAVAQRDMAELVAGGSDTLADIARALVKDITRNLSVDWLSREPVRAKLRTRIRRVLAKFDYPPEEEREAIDLVLRQMETLAELWAPSAKCANPPSGWPSTPTASSQRLPSAPTLRSSPLAERPGALPRCRAWNPRSSTVSSERALWTPSRSPPQHANWKPSPTTWPRRGPNWPSRRRRAPRPHSMASGPSHSLTRRGLCR